MNRLLAAMTIAMPLGLLSTGAFAGETPAPEGAKVYIVSPKDGETVKSPVKVIFGLEGMGVAPAGVSKERTGHHHLLIDKQMSGDALNEPIPSDDMHRHFGGGQTEATIDLPPGKHMLQLIMGDANHIPHNPPIMSDRVTITVE
ncbi:DUF4399 domain-containing protein [Breoghania sp.]|uniref:DUF4399 domain-containing protein n=1 Tax=Breoghania sp. TaxID=2065378 RepID=UPI002AAB04B8|nr:DUF4399 domain-containing protein [Breoghania sp.]